MVLVLIALAALIPVLAGISIRFFNTEEARKNIVITASVILVLMSVMFVIMKNSIELPLEIYIRNNFFNNFLNETFKFIYIILMLAIMFIGVRHKKITVMVLVIVQLIPAVIFEFFIVKHSEKPCAMFLIDDFSMINLILVSLIGPLITVFAAGYMKENEQHKHNSPDEPQSPARSGFFMIMFLFLGVINAMLLSNNLMWMYFFWEAATLCLFFLISHDKNEVSMKNAFRALWMNLLGGIAFISAIILLYRETGTFYINEILELSGSGKELLLLPLGLLCFAGLVKSAQFPFQGWLLSALGVPAPVSAQLHSSTIVNAGVYLILRFSPVYSGTILGKIIAVSGAFTFLAGSVIAISQSNGKKVLTYSTIANMGLIVCCAGIGSPAALGAAILLLIFHTFSKALLFLCIGAVENAVGSCDIEEMRGLFNKIPFTAAVTMLGIISMLLPPFGVIVTNWLAIEAALGIPLVLIMIIFGSTFTTVYWSRWAGNIMTLSYRGTFKQEKLAPAVKLVLVSLPAVILTASLAVGPLYKHMAEPQPANSFNRGFTDLEGLAGGIWLFNGNSPVGGFESVPLFLVLLGLFSLIPLALSKGRPESIRPPYLCGENTGDGKGLEFTSISDKASPVLLHDYYLSGVFDEADLTKWANLIAIAVIFIMFGVSI